MSKAFRCDRCKNLIEDEVPAMHPSLVTGYGEDAYSIRIEVHRTDCNSDTCQACVRKLAADFLKDSA